MKVIHLLKAVDKDYLVSVKIYVDEHKMLMWQKWDSLLLSLFYDCQIKSLHGIKMNYGL